MIRLRDILTVGEPAEPDPEAADERAHVARAAAALDDPDFRPALAALDAELGGLGSALDTAAGALTAAAGDIRRSRAVIRILTEPRGTAR